MGMLSGLFRPAITGVCDKRNPYIRSLVRLAFPHKAGEDYNVFKGQYTAIWDTGARTSMIQKEIAQTYGLPWVKGGTQVFGVNGVHVADEYLVSIIFSNGSQLRSCSVLSLPPQLKKDSFHWIIGLDIILLGNLRLKRDGAKSSFSFKFV